MVLRPRDNFCASRGNVVFPKTPSIPPEERTRNYWIARYDCFSTSRIHCALGLWCGKLALGDSKFSIYGSLVSAIGRRCMYYRGVDGILGST